MGTRKIYARDTIYFAIKTDKMGYYRKGHFKKNGTWVNGHYVNIFGGKKNSKKSPPGCMVIMWGGIISLLFYFLN